MKISPGKQKGLEAVSNSRGVIGAAAMDQRGSLKSAIAKEKGVDKKAVTDQMMAEFKEAVTRVLTPHATAILLDPEYGLSAAKVRAKNAGLLLAYEKSGYDNTQPGRLPDLLDHYSVRRLVAAGADCVKILLYYTPFDPPAVTRPSMPGSNASAANAPQPMCRFSWNLSATKRTPTKKAPASPARSPKSWPAAWRNFPSRNTAWTSSRWKFR